MDSDLADSVSALKESFAQRGLQYRLGQTSPEAVEALKKSLGLPRRYREFLRECDPLDLETATPGERVRLIPTAELVEEQQGFALDASGQRIDSLTAAGWRPTWIIIGISALLGDPYFLDVSAVDAEGDCPVYTAMSGTEQWKPLLVASSFAMFIRILAITVDVAKGFSEDDFDMDDEAVFRESLGPRIREYDPAALKAGHWT